MAFKSTPGNANVQQGGGPPGTVHCLHRIPHLENSPDQSGMVSPSRNFTASYPKGFIYIYIKFVFKIFFSFKACLFTHGGNKTALLVWCSAGIGTDLRNLMSLWHQEVKIQWCPAVASLPTTHPGVPAEPLGWGQRGDCPGIVTYLFPVCQLCLQWSVHLPIFYIKLLTIQLIFWKINEMLLVLKSR